MRVRLHVIAVASLEELTKVGAMEIRSEGDDQNAEKEKEDRKRSLEGLGFDTKLSIIFATQNR